MKKNKPILKVLVLSIAVAFCAVEVGYSRTFGSAFILDQQLSAFLNPSQVKTQLSRGLPEKYEIIRRNFGDFLGVQTFAYILNTLGDFVEDNGEIHELAISSQIDDTLGYIPFNLSRKGKRFFQELFGDVRTADSPALEGLFENINLMSEAYLLTFEPGPDRPSQPLLDNLGLKKIPFGLQVFDPSKKVSYEISFLPFLEIRGADPYFMQYSEAAERELFPIVGNPRPMLQIGRTWTAPPSSSWKNTSEDSDFDGTFEMITIPNNVIIEPTNKESSVDFQHGLFKKSEHLKGKHVREIGVGTGSTLLIASKLGAKSIQGTDNRFYYVLLSLWNIQYARETNQIPTIPTWIIHGDGLADMDEGDTYIFNTPVVVEDTVLRSSKVKPPLPGESMSKSDFLRVFAGLQKVLSKRKKMGILRLRLIDPARFGILSRSDIAAFPEEPPFTRHSLKGRFLASIKLLAQRFLTDQGFQVERFGSANDLFAIQLETDGFDSSLTIKSA